MMLFPNMVAYPAEELRKLGGYRDYYIEDYDLWVHTFATGGTGIYLPGEFSEHRIYTASRSHDPVFYEHCVDSAIASLRDALTYGIAASDRTTLERRVSLLERRRERIAARVALEERLRSGQYAHARRDYLHAAAAYRSRARYLAGLAVMLLSPRLFARTMRRYEGEAGECEPVNPA
jgi:hypothetical protein